MNRIASRAYTNTVTILHKLKTSLLNCAAWGTTHGPPATPKSDPTAVALQPRPTREGQSGGSGTHRPSTPTRKPSSRRGPDPTPQHPNHGGGGTGRGSSHLGGRMMKLTSWSIGGVGRISAARDAGREMGGFGRRSKQALLSLLASNSPTHLLFSPPLFNCFGCGERGGGADNDPVRLMFVSSLVCEEILLLVCVKEKYYFD